MRKAIAFVVVAATFTASRAMADDFTLKRVFLSQGGVAYYEFAATANGAAALTLDVPRDQIDDVMKSLVVFDDKGKIGSVSLAGDAPLELAFRGLPFDEGALSSLPALLNAVKGETVTISGTRSLTGRIVAVDIPAAQIPGAAPRPRLSVSNESGISEVYLDETDSVAFADPEVMAAVNQALDAFGTARNANSRSLRISHDGRGGREVRVGYVAAAPLWKTSYRLTVGGDGKGRLQGWAILENYSGHDWDGVELTLASGNPVTFHQALYQAYFVNRPEIPVELYDRILPPVDDGAVAMDQAVAAAPRYEMAAPSQMKSSRGRLADVQESAHITDSPTQIVFAVDQPVSLASGQSLMLPLINAEVPASRVTYLSANESRPLAAIAVDNKTETALPPGVLTLYDGQDDRADYLGDARVGLVPVGDQRLLNFAADSKTRIVRRDDQAQDIVSGKIVDGILSLTQVMRYRRIFDVTTAKGEARDVMIDVDVPDQWTLAQPKSGVTRTDAGYRIAAAVGAGAQKTIEVVFEDTGLQVFELVNIAEDQLLVLIRGGSLNEDTKRALEAVAQRKRMVTEAKRRLATVQKRYADAVQEQARLSETVKNVGTTGDLAKRYLEKLASLETAIESLIADRNSATTALDAAKEQFRVFVTSLNINA